MSLLEAPSHQQDPQADAVRDLARVAVGIEPSGPHQRQGGRQRERGEQGREPAFTSARLGGDGLCSGGRSPRWCGLQGGLTRREQRFDLGSQGLVAQERRERPDRDRVVVLLRGELASQQVGTRQLRGGAQRHRSVEHLGGLAALVCGQQPFGVDEQHLGVRRRQTGGQRRERERHHRIRRATSRCARRHPTRRSLFPGGRGRGRADLGEKEEGVVALLVAECGEQPRKGIGSGGRRGGQQEQPRDYG
ncbi:MAG: hypothetical protein QM765_35410 [Myxococcales bacterium]